MATTEVTTETPPFDPSAGSGQAAQGRRRWYARKGRPSAADDVLEACRTLMKSGVFQPTAQQVADRAGVAVRTVFQHHASVEEMRLAAIDDEETRLALSIRLFGKDIVRAVVTGRVPALSGAEGE